MVRASVGIEISRREGEKVQAILDGVRDPELWFARLSSCGRKHGEVKGAVPGLPQPAGPVKYAS